MKNNRILVVGAGLTGTTIANELANLGYKVDVIDVRDHVAGNAFDYVNEHGIRVHKYGPHLFHTNNREVFDYLTQFTEWLPYQHRVKAFHNGKHLTLPVNAQTKEVVGEENVLDIFFKPYTLKMWGKPLEEVNPNIIDRVPTRNDLNEIYFPKDLYQAMPKDGYTAMVDKMLDHDNITVSLSTPFDKAMEDDYHHVFNSMPIDVYYDFAHGELPYRSIKFETFTIEKRVGLPVTTVNFTHDDPQTRITEWKRIPGHGVNDTHTTLTAETPCDYKDNNDERYYPINDLEGVNRGIFKKYADIDNPKTTFVGRCGSYAYIDMHQAVNMALKVTKIWIKRQS